MYNIANNSEKNAASTSGRSNGGNREGSRLAPAISEDDLRIGNSIEILLDKIVSLRYIAFTFFIRYVDDRIALSL